MCGTEGLLEATWKGMLSETTVRCSKFRHLDIVNVVSRELSQEGVRIL